MSQTIFDDYRPFCNFFLSKKVILALFLAIFYPNRPVWYKMTVTRESLGYGWQFFENLKVLFFFNQLPNQQKNKSQPNLMFVV